MTRERLRIGVLGAGRWAQIAHIPGWQRDPRIEMVVICDLVEERAQDLAQQFGVPEATTDWQAVVSRPDIDVIDVATATQAHFELAWAALEAGKHVLWPTTIARHCAPQIWPKARA
jgi:predicted dehydrogenase